MHLPHILPIISLTYRSLELKSMKVASNHGILKVGKLSPDLARWFRLAGKPGTLPCGRGSESGPGSPRLHQWEADDCVGERGRPAPKGTARAQSRGAGRGEGGWGLGGSRIGDLSKMETR